MSLVRKQISKPVIEVTVDSPIDSSTDIKVNNNFALDLDELNYKKSRETLNEVATDRPSKTKGTNYLEEIDDGPKRLTSRSNSKNVSSPDISDVKSTEIVNDDAERYYKSEPYPAILLEEIEDHRTSTILEQSPAISHTEDLFKRRKHKIKSTDKSVTVKKGLTTKSKERPKSEDKRSKKADTKKASADTKHNRKSDDLNKRILSKKDEVKNTLESKKADVKKVNDDKKNNKTSDDFNESILSKKDEVTEIRNSVYRTNDAGNGIEIILPSYLLPDDSHFESCVWTPEERGLFLKENNFTHQQRFQTDIFHIRKIGPNETSKFKGTFKTLNYPNIDESNITVRVHIPELSQMNGLCLTFRVYIRTKKQWITNDALYKHKEGVVTFNCNHMESFCVVSTPRDEKAVVTPEGYEFVSEADNRIKVDFPVAAVSKIENVDFKVIPLNRESMATKILRNPRNCFILAISECLAVRHSVPGFEKPVSVQLPVDDLPGIDSSNVECKYGVFKRKHRGSFWLTDLEVDETNGVPTISVQSFSEYVILKVRSEMFGKLQALLPEEIEVAIGDKMCCKILFFVGNRKPNNISVMLECATKDSMEEISQRRSQMGYELVRQCPSPDFFFPVNQRIRVDVGGRFALTKHIGKGYYFLTFFPIAADNFICFPVDRYTGMESAVYGIISFKEDNGTKKDLHAIHYDPWSSRGKPVKSNISGTRSAPVSRQMTATSDTQRERLSLNFDEAFFSDKGLLAMAQSLSPDAMFKVAINLDMSKTQYEQIMNDFSAMTTTSRHLQLLKTALEIKSCETKIQRLTDALRESDENGLAEKIGELYCEKLKLSRANLEKKPSVVQIKSGDQAENK